MDIIRHYHVSEYERSRGLRGRTMYARRTSRVYFLALAIAACLGLTGASAGSDEIVLTLKSGGLTIGGKLVNFDGQNYTLETDALGRITVTIEKFACLGAACPGRPSGAETAGSEVREPPPSPARATLRINGSATLGGKLLPALIRNYAASLGATVLQTGGDDDGKAVFNLVKDGATLLAVDLKRDGSPAAFPALATRDIDIGLTDRPISDTEIGLLQQAGIPGMNGPGHEHIVGLDGIVVLVAPGNSVGTLSAEDISRLFAGEIADWSALGGEAGKVNVYASEDKTGTLQTFRSLVLRPYKRDLAPDAIRAASNADLARQVADDPGGIGFASFAEMGIAKPVRIRDSCGLIHMPSEFAVKSGGYSLSRNLYFYTTNLENKEAAAFVNYATSVRAAEALKEAGFIDASVIAAPFETFRDRIANALNAPAEDFDIDVMRKLMGELGSGERLSATLRFETQIANLDSQSIQQLANAVIFLQKRGLKGRKLILAGFSDALGPFGQNMELSVKRATAARNALVAASTGELRPEDIEVRGYGELLPIACNDTEVGRLKNRRVELWLVPSDQPVVFNKHR